MITAWLLTQTHVTAKWTVSIPLWHFTSTTWNSNKRIFILTLVLQSGLRLYSPSPAFWSMAGLLLQELKGQLRDVPPCLLDVTWLCGSCTDGEAQDKASRELTWHQVDLSALWDLLQQVLGQLIGALRGESERSNPSVWGVLSCLVELLG